MRRRVEMKGLAPQSLKLTVFQSALSSVRWHFRSQLWKESVIAYGKYQRDPRPVWLRHVFEEFLSRNDVWLGETKLGDFAALPAFDQASASWDNAEAGKIAHAIIHNFGDPFERGAIRLILAARAFFTHNNVALVDRLFQNGKDETLSDRLERFFLTLGHEATSKSNEQILKLLLHEKGVPDSVLKAWVSSRWLYQGPARNFFETCFGSLRPSTSVRPPFCRGKRWRSPSGLMTSHLSEES